MALNVKPLGGRIVVQTAPEPTRNSQKGGIIIPDSAREKPMESIVITLGTGKIDDDGKRVNKGGWRGLQDRELRRVARNHRITVSLTKMDFNYGS